MHEVNFVIPEAEGSVSKNEKFATSCKNEHYFMKIINDVKNSEKNMSIRKYSKEASLNGDKSSDTASVQKSVFEMTSSEPENGTTEGVLPIRDKSNDSASDTAPFKKSESSSEPENGTTEGVIRNRDKSNDTASDTTPSKKSESSSEHENGTTGAAMKERIFSGQKESNNTSPVHKSETETTPPINENGSTDKENSTTAAANNETEKPDVKSKSTVESFESGEMVEEINADDDMVDKESTSNQNTTHEKIVASTQSDNDTSDDEKREIDQVLNYDIQKVVAAQPKNERQNINSNHLPEIENLDDKKVQFVPNVNSKHSVLPPEPATAEDKQKADSKATSKTDRNPLNLTASGTNEIVGNESATANFSESARKGESANKLEDPSSSSLVNDSNNRFPDTEIRDSNSVKVGEGANDTKTNSASSGVESRQLPVLVDKKNGAPNNQKLEMSKEIKTNESKAPVSQPDSKSFKSSFNHDASENTFSQYDSLVKNIPGKANESARSTTSGNVDVKSFKHGSIDHTSNENSSETVSVQEEKLAHQVEVPQSKQEELKILPTVEVPDNTNVSDTLLYKEIPDMETKDTEEAVVFEAPSLDISNSPENAIVEHISYLDTFLEYVLNMSTIVGAYVPTSVYFSQCFSGKSSLGQNEFCTIGKLILTMFLIFIATRTEP